MQKLQQKVEKQITYRTSYVLLKQCKFYTSQLKKGEN